MSEGRATKQARRKLGVVNVKSSTKTNRDKLQLDVDRMLLRFEDRGSFWACVPGEKGSKNYIYNIRERLKADLFKFSPKLGWHKKKKKASDKAIGQTCETTENEKYECVTEQGKKCCFTASVNDELLFKGVINILETRNMKSICIKKKNGGSLRISRNECPLLDGAV